MRSEAEEYPKPGSPTELRLILPTESGGVWTLYLSADLESCIGRYARIPEFASRGHVLTFEHLHGHHG